MKKKSLASPNNRKYAKTSGKYTNPANLVRKLCKQKLRPLPEFSGLLHNVLGVLHKTNAQTLADTFQISCGEKEKDQKTAKPNKAISCFTGGD